MTTISVPEYGTDEQQTKLQTLYLGTKWQRLTTIYKRLNDGLATKQERLWQSNAMNTELYDKKR
jgi:hypothetical protein